MHLAQLGEEWTRKAILFYGEKDIIWGSTVIIVSVDCSTEQRNPVGRISRGESMRMRRMQVMKHGLYSIMVWTRGDIRCLYILPYGAVV